MAISRADIGYLMHAGIDMVFGLHQKEEPEEWLQIFNKRTSQRAYEERVMMSGPGYASLFGEDEPVSYGQMRNSWNFITQHEKYGLALRISEEAKDDQQYIQLVAQGGVVLSRSMKATRSARAAAPLNRATSSSYVYGDGQPLLSTAHPLDGATGGTFANTLSAQVDISEASIEEMIRLADYAVSQSGLPISLDVDKFVIAKGLKFDFSRIMDASLRPATADNDPNALRETGYTSRPVVKMRFLTNQKFWGFTTRGSDGDGLVFYERWPMRRGEDTDFETGSLKFKVYARDHFTVDDPRGFFGSSPS